MEKPVITIKPEGIARESDRGELLSDVLIDAGVPLRTPCGGKGICGKCMVRAEGELSPPAPNEIKFLAGSTGSRLACQASVRGDATVHIEAKGMKRTVPLPRIDPSGRFGIAADLGTTTVQVALVDTGKKVSYLLDSFLNPQRRFGHDIISRIFTSREEGLFRKQVCLLREEIHHSLLRALKEMGLPPGRIDSLCFAGNTTMTYFLFGLDVIPLGAYPFRTAELNFDSNLPAEIGFDAFAPAELYALPAASAFLGGDLVGGLTLAETLGYQEGVFFIDLGTNGEMFLRNSHGEIFATSCAMGPALEGMNISYGMTADEGAVCHLRAVGDTLIPSVIGDSEPRGFCGTGLIDLIALLLEAGIINQSGSLGAASPRGPFPSPVLSGNGMKVLPVLGDLSLSQADVRNVQLAKGASLAASGLLLMESRCHPEEIRHVLIAGAFGENLDILRFRRLRFIPEFPNAEYLFLGNTSLQAAAQACMDETFRERAAFLRSALRVIELSPHPAFNDTFLDSLNFPE